MSQNPYWNDFKPKKKLRFEEIQAAVAKALQADNKRKLPCGCLPYGDFILACAGHALIDEITLDTQDGLS